jgi:hypothetical protein
MKHTSIKSRITIIVIFFILLCVGLSYADAIPEKSKNAAGGAPPSSDIDINLSGRILLPRADANGTIASDIEAEIYLKKPGNITEYTVSNKSDGSFKFSPFALKQGNSNFTLEAKASGYSNWSLNFAPTHGRDYNVYITLAPNNDLLFIIFMMPAILGLIAWIAIRGSRRFGRTISVFVIANYLIALLIWVTSSKGMDGVRSDVIIFGYNLGIKWLFLCIIFILLLEMLFIALWPKVWPHLKGPLGIKSLDGLDEETCGESRRLNATGLVATVTALWVLTIAGMFYANFRDGACGVTIFNPGLYIPFYIPIAAFLGILVYAATNIKESFAFGDYTSVYRNKQLALGERVLIGPYIAILAYLMLFRLVADQVKPISTGYGALVAALSLAFFTGLFVKPVLSYLEKIAVKMLPQSDQIELKERDKANEDLTDMLGLSDTLALELQEHKISKIESLMDLTDADIKKIFDKFETVSLGQLLGGRYMAKLYLKEIRALKNLLKLKPEQIDDLKSNQVACIRRISTLTETKLKSCMDLAISDDVSASDLIEKAKAISCLYDELRTDDLIIPSKSDPKISKITDELINRNIASFDDVHSKLIKENKSTTSQGDHAEFTKTKAYDFLEAIDGLSEDKRAVVSSLPIKGAKSIMDDLENLTKTATPIDDLAKVGILTFDDIMSIPSCALDEYKKNDDKDIDSFIVKVNALSSETKKGIGKLAIKDIDLCKTALKEIADKPDGIPADELKDMNINEFKDALSSDVLKFLKVVYELTSEQQSALKDIKLKDLADYFSI